LTAIGEVVVSINHCINNSIAAVQAAARYVRKSAHLDTDCLNALDRIDDECREMEAVVGRLKSLRDATPADYVEGIKMIGLKEEKVDAPV
jgi:hypothetical protein